MKKKRRSRSHGEQLFLELLVDVLTFEIHAARRADAALSLLASKGLATKAEIDAAVRSGEDRTKQFLARLEALVGERGN
jgi:hypothetical protein